jgi:hypothetical protein
MKHIQTFESFLNERDLSSPVNIEIEAGKVKVYADPEAENWRGETIRTELYEELAGKFESALKEEDDAKIKQLLSDVRDLPLFSQDKSNAWKMSQIDGVEQFRSGAEYRRWLCRYVLNKIEFFLDWARNN